MKAVVGVDRGTGGYNAIMPKLGYGSTYRLLQDVSVAGGQMLTIQPGVTIELPSHFIDLLVDGTLMAQGTAVDSIRFRGVASSSTSHGGTVFFRAGSSASVMDNVIVERMGDTNYEGAAIYISQGETPTIHNTAIRFSEKDDFHVWAGGARKFSNVKAVVGVDRGTGSFNSIMPKLGYDSPYRLLEDITVAGGQVLTIQPGVTVEFPLFHRDLFVDGTLLAQGTPSDSIRFVGKSNPGSSSSTHGGAILFNVGSSASVMDHVIVERMGDISYKGYAIYVETGETPTIQNICIRYSERDDFNIWAGGARKFSNVKAVVGISRGTGNFNAIMPKLGYSSPYRLLEDITVAGGQTLTIQPGVTVEFPIFHRDLFVDGTLLAQGTPSDSIRFVGKPNPGSSSSTHGGAILFNVGSSASVMDHVIVERMGDVSYKGYAIFLESNCTIKNTTVKNSEHTGIYIKQGQYIFNNCSIYANAVYGVFNASTSATDIADARSCYWGTQTGPYHHTLNPSGTGNRVSDKVLFNPWLTSPPSNCIPITIKSGNWNDPTVWLCGQVPSSSDPVVLRHVVNVPGSYTARVSQVAYEAGGSLSMSTNGKLKLGN